MGVFQTNIEWLLKSHNLLEEFQTQEHFHVRFTMPGFDRLVIERHGELISVAHYFEQEGDLIADPEVELHFPPGIPLPSPRHGLVAAKSSSSRTTRNMLTSHFTAKSHPFSPYGGATFAHRAGTKRTHQHQPPQRLK